MQVVDRARRVMRVDPTRERGLGRRVVKTTCRGRPPAARQQLPTAEHHSGNAVRRKVRRDLIASRQKRDRDAARRDQLGAGQGNRRRSAPFDRVVVDHDHAVRPDSPAHGAVPGSGRLSNNRAQ
jgi:hypothetical protein